MSQKISKTKKAGIAFATHQKVVFIKEHISDSFLELGRWLFEMYSKNHYKRLGYDSWVEYVATPEIAMSQGTTSKLINIYKELVVKYKFPRKQLRKIEWSKLAEVMPVIKGIEKKKEIGDWLKKAEVLTQRDLRIEAKEKKTGVLTSDCEHDWIHREYWKCGKCDIISYVKPYES